MKYGKEVMPAQDRTTASAFEKVSLLKFCVDQVSASSRRYQIPNARTQKEGFMPTSIGTLVKEIQTLTNKMASTEGKAVLHAIELSRCYTALRKQVKNRQWEKTLAALGTTPRVACRYLVISKSWWIKQAPGPELLALMPCDLHKLEALSKLEQQALSVLLKAVNCKDSSRGEVISAVDGVLGVPHTPSADDDEVTLSDLKKRWEGSIRKIIADIEDLDNEDLDDEAREDLWTDLSKKFSEVEAALYPPEEEDPDASSGPSDDEDDELGDETDEDDEEAAVS